METIIIVYGNNQPINASSYRIRTVQKSFEKNIQSDLVLDIYIIYGTDSCSTVNELLDINGEIIKFFKGMIQAFYPIFIQQVINDIIKQIQK